MGAFYSRIASAQTTSFDFYISPSGSDTNSGTKSSPWSLTALNSKRSTYAGKRVGLLPGVYNIASYQGVYSGTSAYVPAFSIAGGDATHQTVIQSTIPLGAIFDCGGTSTSNPNGVPVIGCHQQQSSGSLGGTLQGYITIDGLEIRNWYYGPIVVGYINSASTPTVRCSGIVVQNCYIHGGTNQITQENPTGITIEACDGALIQNNFITDLTDSTYRGMGIEQWTSVNSLIQYNTIVSTGNGLTGGIGIKNNANHDNTIRYNFIDLSAEPGSRGPNSGIRVDSTGASTSVDTVNNNVVIAQIPVGPALIVVGGYPLTPSRQVWFNNTLVSTITATDSAIVRDSAVFERYGATGVIQFWNNILTHVGTGPGRGDIQSNKTAFGLIDYNFYPATNPVWNLCADGAHYGGGQGSASSLPAWRLLCASASPASLGMDAHSLTAATPGFTASGTRAAQYKLATGSPCIGAGSVNGTTTGSACDLGAWGNGATRIGSDISLVAAPSRPLITVS